jgi:hypothetical protein
MKLASPVTLVSAGIVLAVAALGTAYVWRGEEPVRDVVVAVRDRCYSVIAGQGFVDEPAGAAGCSGDAANVRVVTVRSPSGGVYDVQIPITTAVTVGDSWPR